ncbi:Peptidoglycan biosynthesis protein MviN/MurJ, putative lipid II flippase [Flavobacterium micromati]|uniref:Peptidoglycan biosynthesis protein MviN/MurJ, putative lipid II flippase n=1 Tax=Flavobacterium micromati TaxID=229205 RepID=A0A1M5H119_9FLAO|nr:oligosaccharide flippase family protein [Flavobacterium micromati]SHG09620.1 Peptidoglycan biosynthesis protein MviN/MurJ, putative lipid II flippase [Flavobacterium micromati]
MKATGVFGFSQVLRILVGLVGSKFIAVFLGTTGIGIIGILQNTLAIISSITSFGINISGVRMVAIAHSNRNQEEFSKTIIVLRRWSIASGILGVLICFFLAKPLSIWTFGSTEYVNWFLVLSINFIFSSLAVEKMVILQATRSMKAIAISSVIYAISVTAVSIPIYYYFRLDGIVAVLILTTILNYLINWFFAKKIETIPVQISVSETVLRGVEMIQLGLLLSVNVIIGHFISYLLALYFNFQNESNTVLGLYVVSSTLLVTYTGMIFTAMSTDFYPRLTNAQDDNLQVKSMVNDQIEIGLILITPLIIGFYFLAPFIIKLLYSKEFLDVVLILKFALLAVIIKAIMWPLAFIILAKGEKKLYLQQEIFSHLLNITLTILLYEYLDLLGIGLATLLNYILYSCYVYRVVKNKFQFSFRKNTLEIIFKSVILGAIASATVVLIDYPYAIWFLGVLCIASIYLSYAELNKRINVNEYCRKIKDKWRSK